MSAGQHYTLRVEAFANNGTDGFVNVFVYEPDANETTAASQAEGLAAVWISEVLPEYRALCTDDIIFQNVRVRCLEDPFQFYDEINLNLAGTIVATPTAFQVAAVGTWRTGALGRRFRGRTFFFPTSQIATGADGAWGSSTISAYSALMDDMILIGDSGLSSANYGLQVWSRAGGLFTPVLSGSISPAPGTLRSRRLGRGF